MKSSSRDLPPSATVGRGSLPAPSHTPGPWVLRRRDGVQHGDSNNLGWDWDWEHPENTPPEPMRGMFEKEADARLVMAAPDLLEAALFARQALGDMNMLDLTMDEHRAYEMLEVATDKALGVSLRDGEGTGTPRPTSDADEIPGTNT